MIKFVVHCADYAGHVIDYSDKVFMFESLNDDDGNPYQIDQHESMNSVLLIFWSLQFLSSNEHAQAAKLKSRQ